jgi:acyl-CoA synthetase (AMP-forming)/AMP-acid ligase II
VRHAHLLLILSSLQATILTHDNLCQAVAGKGANFGNNRQDVYLNWISADHVACLTEIHLAAMRSGAEQIHAKASDIIMDPSRFLSTVEKYKVSYTFAPNFLLEQILQRPLRGLDLSSLKVLVSGGEGVPVQTGLKMQAYLEECGASPGALVAGFGMTETCVSQSAK